MFWAVKQLGTPLRYLSISQGSGLLRSKRTYDWFLPLIAAGASVLVLRLWSIPVGFFAEGGLVSGVIDLLNLLVAFFIAALAAVATFDRRGLDDPMKGEPAQMRRLTADGTRKDFILTHRQFICYLFGYLSFVSLLLLIVLHLVRLFIPPILAEYPISPGVLPYATHAADFVFFFVLWQLTIAMLLGIYFLCDRLQFLAERNV